MTDSTLAEEPIEDLGPEQGGGPPALMPWTLVVEDEGWSADLEHGAWLPAVGDRIDFIAEDGRQRAFRVKEVIHTVQSSASQRPPLSAGTHTPNSTVDGATDGPPRELRAGLPRVVVTAEG
ncbi:MAG TPA: hypothetical protein VFN76_04990 [Candidatus Limnocylindria bacterium]|nr:hypothetical protein [Candidatus Limnocylindria bacterium]